MTKLNHIFIRRNFFINFSQVLEVDILNPFNRFYQISNEPVSFCWHGSVRPTKSF